MRIFVPAVGQYDNIGDLILRRPLLDGLRQLGDLNVFVGDAPEGYTSSLMLEHSDHVYRNFLPWYRELLRSESPTHYVFKPGEIQLTLPGLKEHVAMMPALLKVRARNGRVVRIGAGARQLSKFPRELMRASLSMTDLAIWRDSSTAAFLGGDEMADLGFLGGSDESSRSRTRDQLVVSLRGDRNAPAPEWYATVQELATRLGLGVSIATQVKRDNLRTLEVAERLGARPLEWDAEDHITQESRLRELYGRASIVLSDRLHVLIAAATEGARVVSVASGNSEKISRHFDTAGYPPIVVDTRGLLAADAARAIHDVVDSVDYSGALDRARASAHNALDRMAEMLRS